jgi:phospholipid/cholesterol/gamma-HCH transport system substrate-binding protein
MRTKVMAMALAATLGLAGCSGGFRGIYDMPLPGGADLGDNPYTVRAQFQNVRDLVPQAAVKVNDVAVGRVTEIRLPQGSWTAEVVMRVNGRVRLPANAGAHLVQSSLLGEKYVKLIAPPSGAQGTLADGSVIPVSRTNRDPEVEEVFGALSLLLNGGGLAQLRTIAQELNKAFSGNEAEIRSLLRRLNTFTSELNTHRDDITAALDALDRLSTNLNARRGQIDTVLSDLSPGLKVLEEQRGQLVTMLEALEDLGTVANRVIDRTKDDFVADLRALDPILENIADAGQSLPRSLEVLATYPFSDAALAAVKGDYMNIYLRVTAVPGTKIIPPYPNGLSGPPPGGGTATPLPLPAVEPTSGPPSADPDSVLPPLGAPAAGGGGS